MGRRIHQLAFALIILTIANLSHCANILAFFGISSDSHILSLSPVLNRLSSAGGGGHNVTVLTPFRPRPGSLSPKVTVVYAEEIYALFRDQWDEGADLIGLREAGQSHMIWEGLADNALLTCKTFLEAHTSQALLHNSQFDLTIVDMTYSDCGFALAALHYKCPYVGYAAIAPMSFTYDDYGFPAEYWSIPDLETGTTKAVTILDRVIAAWQPLKWYWRKHAYFYPQLASLLKEHLKKPDIDIDMAAIHRQTSLVLMNSHYSVDYARSLPPLFVQVGGIGINEERRPLPAEINNFISRKSSKGFVYVCFGAAVRISKASPALRAKLFSAMAAWPEIEFLWKWEGVGDAGTGRNVKGDDAEAIRPPPNVFFSEWLPQQDLLADPRILGYIGHGGLNGINEALHFGVPMILFPIFADQNYNAGSLAAKELAIVLEITDFTQQELHDAIGRLMNDGGLYDRISVASRIARDRQTPPLESAVWWLEYVLRHHGNGTPTHSFLMPPGARESWFVRRGLDIWTLATVSFLLTGYTAMYLSGRVWTLVSKKMTLTPTPTVRISNGLKFNNGKVTPSASSERGQNSKTKSKEKSN